MATYRMNVRLSHPSLGGTGTNTWHARTSGVPTEDTDDLNALAARLEDFYSALSGQFAPAAVISFDGAWQQILDANPGSVEADGWSVTSTGAGEVMPPAVALVVGWRANTGGRSGRGRTFLGPLSMNVSQFDGTPASGNLSTIRAAAQTLIDAQSSPTNGAFGIYSPTDQVIRDITSVRVRDIFASLRSRRD